MTVLMLKGYKTEVALHLGQYYIYTRYVSAAWPKKSGRLKTQFSLIYTAISH